MRVTRGTLLAAIRGGARSVEALQYATGASTGCGTCHYDLLQLLADGGPALGGAADDQ
ncbi:MAG: (2Fe-2S)-binding protein [Planctomycetes bacterium]|nr:(2Fe-2S)-binding protein [Planctomycetota bacterium]